MKRFEKLIQNGKKKYISVTNISKNYFSSSSSSSTENKLLKTIVISKGANMDLTLEKNVLSKISTVQHFEEFNEEAMNAHAIISWRVPALRKLELEQMKNCVMISRVGVGVDSVDIKTAGELGIRVNNIPAYGTKKNNHFFSKLVFLENYLIL